MTWTVAARLARPQECIGIETLSVCVIGFILLSFNGHLLVLRTRFQTTAATHALAEWVILLLLLSRLLWPATHVVVAINGNPTLQFFQCSEQPIAIDAKVTHHWEFAHRAKFNSRRIVNATRRSGATVAKIVLDLGGCGNAGSPEFFAGLQVKRIDLAILLERTFAAGQVNVIIPDDWR